MEQELFPYLLPFEKRILNNEWFRKNYSKLRVRCGFVIALILLILSTDQFHYWGLLFSVTGLLIRSWAAGYLTKNKELTVTGPYALVQHPLYLGSFLIGLGVVIFVGNLSILLFYVAGFGLLYHLTMRIEEMRMLRLFGSVYIEYHSRTPRIIPRITKLPALDSSNWFFAQFMKNREYRELLGQICFVGVLIFRQHISHLIF